MLNSDTSRLNSIFFFFNDTATTEIYTLSLHDALPICIDILEILSTDGTQVFATITSVPEYNPPPPGEPQFTYYRSEEHTSELQSRLHLVCRLLLEKKKKTHRTPPLY